MTADSAPSSGRRLLGAAAVIALGNVLSRGLGLVRDQVIAYTFGANAGTDAYVLARTIPTIVYDLLVGTVSTAAFVPVFVQYARDQRQLWRLVSIVLSLALLAFVVVTAVLALLADQLIDIIGRGFRTPEQRELAASLMRIALISVIFQGLAGVLTSTLYAQNRFTLPAFATAIYNVGIIAAVLVLGSTFGVPALAIGLVVGALAQFVLQAAGLKDLWLAFRPRIDLADPAIRQILRLGATVALGLLVTIAGVVIDRTLASGLGEGSMTSMEFATRVIQFPLGIVGLAVSYAVLPTLTRFSAGPDASLDGYRQALLFGLKLVLLLMLPAFGVLAALAQPVTAVIFEHGEFVAADTARTAAIFQAYSPMLPLTGIDYLLINAFYARQDARTPVLVGVGCVLIYLAVALSTIGALGAVGLALANATQNSSHALILLVLLNRSMPGLRVGRALWPFLARTIPAATVTGAAIFFAWPVLSPLGGLFGLLAAGILATAIYGLLILLLGVSEAHEAVRLLRIRFTPQP